MENLIITIINFLASHAIGIIIGVIGTKTILKR